jgi:hypothetical protein
VLNDSGGPLPVFNITDLVGDKFNKISETISPGATSVSIWQATGITASGANTATISWLGGNPGRAQIYIAELQGSTLDSVITGIGSQITAPIHFSNALALGAGFDGAVASWGNLGSVNGSELDFQLQHNVASVIYGNAGVNPAAAIGIAVYSISATPTFVTGWSFTAENSATTGLQNVTPTASLINTQSALPMVPNEWCDPMSNGTGYNAKCGFIPNLQVNGIMGGAIEIAGRISNNISADIGATTLTTTGANDAFYKVDASITCRGAVAGQPTLTITFTDTSNTVQTIATSGVDCTALGASSWGALNKVFRAKAATNIQVTTTHANSQPTYDVAVAIYQEHTL